MQTIKCKIEQVNNLNQNTHQVLLQRDSQLQYYAGQYLQIVLPSGAKHPFSIASAPCNEQHIELHIRATPDSKDSLVIEQHFKTVAALEIEMPLGDCLFEQAPDRPLILIAAGTGITQMKSISEQCFHWGFNQDIHLYWGNLCPEDIYFQKEMAQWALQHSNFHLHNVISDLEKSPNWRGRSGLVPHAVLDDFKDLSEVIVVVSGGPNMVYATLDLFMDNGMPQNAMHSDIFSYAPRA